MGNLEKGYTQIYTGNGKGKTTAAMGLGFRACGDGMIVHVVQFLKSFNTGELNSAKILGENFKIYRFETPKGFTWQLSDEEKKLLQEEIKKECSDDEINFAIQVLKETLSKEDSKKEEVVSVNKNSFIKRFFNLFTRN